MYYVDYHLHTAFSFDCEEPLEQVCEAAITAGLSEIALTDHLDIYSDHPYTWQLDCPNWYLALQQAQEKYAGRLTIRKGIELGSPQANPAEAAAFYKQYPLDFIIGSIHNMENDIDVYYYDFHEKDYRQVYRDYISWLTTLATDYDFDVLGHITYPSRYIQLQLGTDPDLHEFEPDFKKLFAVLLEKGHGIELNTSGFARGDNFCMPPLWLVKLYKDCGGEIITTGSDAHVKEQVGSTAKLAVSLLKEAGFSYITTFQERKPCFHKI